MSVLKNEIELIRKMLANGGRWLIIANFYFACAIAALVTVVVFTQCTVEPYGPLDNKNPQAVENKIVEQGGVLLATGTKCNRSDETLTVSSESWFQSIDHPTRRVTRSEIHSVIRLPGCVTRTFANPIPRDLPTGLWQIQASEVARSSNNETQSTGWATETFEVVEGEHE